MLLDYRHENRVQIEIGCDGGTNKTKGEKLETLKIPFFFWKFNPKIAQERQIEKISKTPKKAART